MGQKKIARIDPIKEEMFRKNPHKTGEKILTLLKLGRGEICVANFIPPANGVVFCVQNLLKFQLDLMSNSLDIGSKCCCSGPLPQS